ncbi:MAG TPA: 30S ribosomal protein S15 [Bdellovibrionales bacterium]|nr:30S ribosomal protein S15 [Pseudobdellovibrionaceae bacterium]HAG91034.1 30S ribosomal protein S15 [Bdellovibrionales bacterium]|tara:strand:- start:876 stop:1145 length:270 start_codon:yes stop_codon:yes gene_type:complete
MALGKEIKEELVKKFKRSELDTGSPEVQVSIMTTRITELTEHFKKNKNDKHSQRGLIRLVNRRRKLLDYLKKNDLGRYQTLIGELGIRK